MRNIRKHGVSLMSLVLTVIIMTILTGTIVISLNNTNMIDRSNDAVNQYNAKNIEQMANVAWAEAYLANITTQEGIQNYIDEYFEKQNIDTSEYGIAATAKGVEVVRGWAQAGTTIVKGDNKIIVGQKIGYSEPSTQRPAANVKAASELEWVVLGAEDGKILIAPTENVGNATFNESTNTYKDNVKEYDPENGDELIFSLNGASDYVNNVGVDKLNEYCKNNYGKGTNAVSVRSITVEDLNKITGYNPEKTGDGSVSQEGTVFEYGNIVTYRLSTDGTKIGYTSAAESNLDSSTLLYSKFIDITGATIGATKDTANNVVTDVTLKNTYYWYSPLTLTEDLEGEKVGMSENSETYKALFEGTTWKHGSYWLASPVICTADGYAYWGLRAVHGGNVATVGTHYSRVGAQHCRWFGIRPVVTLAEGIELTYNNTTGQWDII